MVSLYNIVKIVINWIVSELRHRSTLQCLNFKTVPVLMHVKHCLTEMQNAVHSQTIIHLTLVHSLTLREVTAYTCSQGPSILFLLSGKLPGDAIEVFHIMPAVDAPRHCPHIGRHPTCWQASMPSERMPDVCHRSSVHLQTYVHSSRTAVRGSTAISGMWTLLTQRATCCSISVQCSKIEVWATSKLLQCVVSVPGSSALATA